MDSIKWKEKLKKCKSWLIKNAVSILALVFSVYSYAGNIRLTEKYDKLSTYEMPLNYQVKISDKAGEGKLIFDGKEINKGQIDLIPKIGGIEKVYAIHYYKDNVKWMEPLELYSQEIKDHDAHDLFYRLDKYSIDNIAHTTSEYFGTLYLLVKDYQNNYYTNMIVYEIKKDDITNVQTRIYSDIDLLHVYNQDINVLPEFDLNQMKEYQNLKNKIDKIL